MKNILHRALYLAPFAPVLAFAQAGSASPDLSYFDNFVTGLVKTVNLAIPLLIALGLLFFIWGLVAFIFSAGDDDAKKKGKDRMIWGVIALFVIVSIWGLVGLLNQITNVQQGQTFQRVNTQGT